MLLRTQKYDYTVVYRKSTEMFVADTLRRTVKFTHKGNPRTGTQELFIGEVEKELRASTWLFMLNCQRKDCLNCKWQPKKMTICLLMKIVHRGWPNEGRNVPYRLQEYFPFREELPVKNRLLVKAERIVVPSKIREKVTSLIHMSHTGLQGCLRRAREVVVWPEMSIDMEKLIGQCETCQAYQRNQPEEPMISQTIPDLP